MSELGLFHHSTLAETAAAFTHLWPHGPEPEQWLQKFSRAAHGDFPRWLNALNGLPALDNPKLTAGSIVRIAGTTDSPALNQELRTGLANFMPWRKGPFAIGQVNLDTEWRSDWKWARLSPHLPDITGHKVLDIGCGNGYFGWQLLQQGAAGVLGVDPTLLFCMQHLVINRFARSDTNWVVPLTFEELRPTTYDGVMSLGVIYHRKDPQTHVERLFEFTRPGGWVVLETLCVDGDVNLQPTDRYARMRNVWCVPTIAQTADWLDAAGFCKVKVVDVETTSRFEQRPTRWMNFESLDHALNGSQTVEGYAGPRRAIAIAERPQ